MATIGTTSAYAENTTPSCPPNRYGWNYLRVRGEYASSNSKILISWELPPRTRRILWASIKNYVIRGTTSAYAENTALTHNKTNRLRNYLRVRGEYYMGIRV